MLLHSTTGTIGDVLSTMKWPRTARRKSATTACTCTIWHRDTLTDPHPITHTVSPAIIAVMPMSLRPWEAGSMATHTVCTESDVGGACWSRGRSINDALSSFSGR